MTQQNMSSQGRLHFLLLNIGHFLDHFAMLIFATVAALVLTTQWGLSYGELLAYATPGFVAFGIFALPAGWLADKWSRDGMMCVFFFGLGLAALLTSQAQTPLQIGVGLFVIGLFAAIYHPVGLALVTAPPSETGDVANEGPKTAARSDTGMRLATNGVWGNLGVAAAPLATGFLIDLGDWRLAFLCPGILSLFMGLFYLSVRKSHMSAAKRAKTGDKQKIDQTTTEHQDDGQRDLILRVSGIVFLTTALASIIFQSTTFALPKIFDERLGGLAANFLHWFQNLGLTASDDVATMVGGFAFIVFAVASMAQLVVGKLLDKYGARPVFLGVAAIQIGFFSAMPGLENGIAFAVALGFMLGAFGQIPINDFMIGKMASGAYRARIYGIRYVVSFTVLAATLPMIGFVYEGWGFDMLFRLLAVVAMVIFGAVALLPSRLPTPAQAAVG